MLRKTHSFAKVPRPIAGFTLALLYWASGAHAQDLPADLLDEEVTALETSASQEHTPEQVADGEESVEEDAADQDAAEQQTVERDTVGITRVRRAPTRLSFKITSKELKVLPGAFGDAFRAVGTLPGLTPIFSGFPFYYVRGAPPANVGYRYDGIQLPSLFHVGIGPSVLHPAFVDSVTLHPGGFGANLGQFSGGFITAESTPPAFEFRGEAQIRLFDLGAFVERPFADGKGTFSIGGRYSYTAALLSQFAPNAVLDYNDFQARLTYELTPEDRLTVFALSSYDLFGSDANGILQVGYGQEFYRLSVVHQHDYADGDLWRTQVTGGYDRSIFGFDSASRAYTLNARTRYETRVAPDLSLRTGGEVNVRKNETVDAKYLDPDQVGADFFGELFPSRVDTSAGVWVDAAWDATAQLRFTPGARFDAYRSQKLGAFSLEPRLRADYSLTASSGLVAAVGLAHQPPSFAFPVGGLVPVGLGDGLQRTLSTSFGVRSIPWSGAQASATVFYNRFSNMTDALGGDAEGGGPDTDLAARSSGYAVGLETNFTGKLSESVTGLVSYTLSRSVRDISRRRVYSQFDRTHVLNTALTYSFGKGYSMGFRYLAYTGLPFADDNGNASVGTTPDRSRFYQRLDVRLEKRWKPDFLQRLSLVAEGLNVTGSTEETAPGIDGPAIILPSIGLEGAF